MKEMYYPETPKKPEMVGGYYPDTAFNHLTGKPYPETPCMPSFMYGTKKPAEQE